MRIALDTNIFVYAFDQEAGEKHHSAADIVARAARADTILPTQVLAEFLNVVRRKNVALLPIGIEQARRWSLLFPTIDTSPQQALAGARMAMRHRLQLWDCVIWQVVVSAGASALISEDLQDGFELDGVTLVNPFVPNNRNLLADLLTETPD